MLGLKEIYLSCQVLLLNLSFVDLLFYCRRRPSESQLRNSANRMDITHIDGLRLNEDAFFKIVFLIQVGTSASTLIGLAELGDQTAIRSRCDESLWSFGTCLPCSSEMAMESRAAKLREMCCFGRFYGTGGYNGKLGKSLDVGEPLYLAAWGTSKHENVYLPPLAECERSRSF